MKTKTAMSACRNEVFQGSIMHDHLAISHSIKQSAKYAGREYKKYALIASFAEFDETIEQTVQREVMEEVRIQGKESWYARATMGIFRESAVWLFCRGRRRPYDLQAGRTLAEAMWVPAEEIVLDMKEINDKKMMQVFQKEHCKKSEEGVSESWHWNRTLQNDSSYVFHINN